MESSENGLLKKMRASKMDEDMIVKIFSDLVMAAVDTASFFCWFHLKFAHAFVLFLVSECSSLVSSFDCKWHKTPRKNETRRNWESIKLWISNCTRVLTWSASTLPSRSIHYSNLRLWCNSWRLHHSKGLVSSWIALLIRSRSAEFLWTFKVLARPMVARSKPNSFSSYQSTCNNAFCDWKSILRWKKDC